MSKWVSDSITSRAPCAAKNLEKTKKSVEASGQVQCVSEAINQSWAPWAPTLPYATLNGLPDDEDNNCGSLLLAGFHTAWFHNGEDECFKHTLWWSWSLQCKYMHMIFDLTWLKSCIIIQCGTMEQPVRLPWSLGRTDLRRNCCSKSGEREWWQKRLLECRRVWGRQCEGGSKELIS